MLSDQPLPNDLLRNAPWSQTIISWPINEAMLSVIQESEKQIEAAGFYLKYGIEINLGLLTITEAALIRDRQDSPIMASWRLSCREQFARDLARAGQMPPFPALATALYNKLQETAVRYVRRGDPESMAWQSNWQTAQSFYQTAITTNKPDQAALARKDFMISALHLLPQQLGGLEGLIEQRFASAHYGHGWWDGRNTLELRTLPVQGHRPTIESYHHVLWRLQSAVEQMGLVPLVDRAKAQVHFSLWSKRDDTNIMARDDEEALALRRQLANGMCNDFVDMPYGLFSKLFDKNPIDAASFVGSDRTNVIRTCDDNWELRLPSNDAGVTHLARDLLYINSMIANQFRSEPQVHDKEDDPGEQAIFICKVLGIPKPKDRTKVVKRPIVKADPPRVACPIISSIECAVLGDKNELLASQDALQWNLYMLRKIVGSHGLDLFSAQYDETIYNLGTAYGWHQLLKEIRVRDDLTLDLSRLHPELARHFEGLTIAALRSDIHMTNEGYDFFNGERRRFANAAITRFLEHGTLHAYPEEALDAQREIFGFVRKQQMHPSSEEATCYLLGLLEKIRRARDEFRNSYANPSDAVCEMLLEILIEPLNDKGKYCDKHLELLTPAADDREILDSLLSFRKIMLAALPDAARYDPPETTHFFRQLGHYLKDPLKLYSFANVKVALETMALDYMGTEIVDTSDPEQLKLVKQRLEALLEMLDGQPEKIEQIMQDIEDPAEMDALRETQCEQRRSMGESSGQFGRGGAGWRKGKRSNSRTVRETCHVADQKQNGSA